MNQKFSSQVYIQEKGKYLSAKEKKIVQECLWESPGGPMIRTPHFHCCGPCLIPSLRTNILQTVWHNQKKKNRKKKKYYKRIFVASLFVIAKH